MCKGRILWFVKEHPEVRRLLYLLEVSRHMTISFTGIAEQTLKLRAVQSAASKPVVAHSHAVQSYLLLSDNFKPKQAEG